jgi:hypothetical protein
LTRQITGSQLPTGGYANPQQGASAQSTTAAALKNIGDTAGQNAASSSFGGNGLQIPDANSLSYASQITGGTYGSSQSLGAGNGSTALGTIEASPSGGTVYEALWEVPTGNSVSGAGDTYEGYFTFKSDGEVDFTEVAVPEPSTYGLIAGLGLLGLAFRRQLRALTA